jgi:hypothetical protein
MRLRWVIDRILRIVAALTLLVAAGFLFFAGIFAGDSGTLKSEIITMAIWVGGGTVVVSLALAILASPISKPPSGSSPGGGIPLATLLVYLVAVAGVAAYFCRNLIFAGV